MPASQSNDFIKVIRTNHDEVTKIKTENASTLPTREEVRKEEEEWKTSIEAARKKEQDHTGKSWTTCYDDECLVHISDKDTAEWFPKQHRNSHQPRRTEISPGRNATAGAVESLPIKGERVGGRTQLERRAKKKKKQQTNEWLDTESETDSTVPDTTESLLTQLTKPIEEQRKLKEALKGNQVVLEQLKRDLKKERFEVVRPRTLTTLAQQSARGAILGNFEFYQKLLKIHQASKSPERTRDDQTFIASMTWRTA